MSFNNFLWKLFMSRVARKHGFVDPMVLFSRLVNFSQPSEVAAPTELLRATAVLHARGLVNSQAIQHNLDWVWPYWVNRQFDPHDNAFIPRAFSLTHINLTHRTWTALGLPDSSETPLVDPCGLVTPFWDGWSIDGWFLGNDSELLIPSQRSDVAQKLDLSKGYSISTSLESDQKVLLMESQLTRNQKNALVCHSRYTVGGDDGDLVISIRPYNPEGISFIESIEVLEKENGLLINNKQKVLFDKPWSRCVLSNYKKGDVFYHLKTDGDKTKIKCKVGLATVAIIFPKKMKEVLTVNVGVPLEGGDDGKDEKDLRIAYSSNETLWNKALEGVPKLSIANKKFEQLYDAAVRTLMIHTVEDVYAGPFVYKRFWFRDAAYILNTLLSLGLFDRVEKHIGRFPSRQKMSGYFLSQEGEWDSNGEVLWLLERYQKLTRRELSDDLYESVKKAAKWIIKKRLPDDKKTPHSGLMPPGFSAEHFGPNDYYYWDDFWNIAGLQSASYLAKNADDQQQADHFLSEAQQLKGCVEESLQSVAHRLGRLAIPASPYRRLDSAAVGSLVLGYPLQIEFQKDTRLLDTANYLIDQCLVGGSFFHDMSHSGINPYLTLHIAQVLLRAKDKRYLDLMTSIAGFSTDTGVWAEAMHPKTKGGCMGDCQHVWAASEWIMMIHYCFVREEGDKLILCSGVSIEWLKEGEKITLGPVATRYGKISIHIQAKDVETEISYKGEWYDKKPDIVVDFIDEDLRSKKFILIEL